MKYNNLKIVALLLCTFLYNATLLAQPCDPPNAATGTGGLPSTCDGSGAAQDGNAGDVLTFNLTGGNTYTFSTCSTPSILANSQLDLWNADFSTLLGSNDDDCTFLSTITYSPTTDIMVQLAIYESSCQSSALNFELSVSCTTPPPSNCDADNGDPAFNAP